MKKDNKKNSVQFRQSGYSGKALTALISGILTVIVFLILVFYSGIKEETPQAFAVCATAAMVVSFIGLIVSIKCVREQDGGYAVPYAGMTVNGLAFLTYIITYFLGAV